MKQWKEAIWLATLELKTSPLNYLFALCITGLLGLFFITSFSSYIENNYVGFDLFFMLLFSILSSWFRGKDYQYQKVSGSIWASPTYIMQTTLPIPLDTLAKSRLIFHFLLSFPLQVLILSSAYMLTPALQSFLSAFEYIAFAIIWLSFGVYAGYIMPAGDAGDKLKNRDIVIGFVGILVGLTVLFTFFHLLLGYGVVYWTMKMAQNSPFLSIIISTLIAGIGFNYWTKTLKKRTKRMDYL
ncbi:hypothetical protein ACLIBG_05530 [Virgibacillus sp. W0181]|uniref:hypothetical protein n=1 Tax=Virgibacillus sp. W0181 TaxID=3391581 RepID=UPI003F44894A